MRTKLCANTTASDAPGVCMRQDNMWKTLDVKETKIVETLAPTYGKIFGKLILAQLLCLYFNMHYDDGVSLVSICLKKKRKLRCFENCIFSHRGLLWIKNILFLIPVNFKQPHQSSPLPRCPCGCRTGPGGWTSSCPWQRSLQQWRESCRGGGGIKEGEGGGGGRVVYIFWPFCGKQTISILSARLHTFVFWNDHKEDFILACLKFIGLNTKPKMWVRTVSTGEKIVSDKYWIPTYLRHYHLLLIISFKGQVKVNRQKTLGDSFNLAS